MVVLVSMLAGTGASCGTPCETPVALSCCEGGCNGDAGTPALCGPAGWSCPPGAIAAGDCPSTPKFCSGALSGPGGG